MTAPGCLLPSFEKVGSELEPMTEQPDGGPAMGPVCGISDRLPESCDACIREHCCEEAKACDESTACGEDLLEAITPVADFSADFDPMLACMQRSCDAACDVSWGCVGNYRWPTPTAPYTVDITVVDFAADPDKPLKDVMVRACSGIDPTCMRGLIDDDTTGADGKVSLTLPEAFEGFFTFEGGGYLPTTVQWSEPVSRVLDWKHYQLDAVSLRGLAVVTGVHQTAQEEFDPAVGHLIFRVQSCAPLRYLVNDELPLADAANVVIEIEPDDGASDVFYTSDTGGVSIALKATSSAGVGGAFNVPARNLNVTATNAEDGKSERS